MTNEELVTLIKAGDRSKMFDLWQQNQGFICKKAQKILTALTDAGRCGADFDDLVQTAYIGLDKAVKAYDPDKGFAFITYFGKVLSSVLWNSVGFHDGAMSDALDNSISLETPLGNESDCETLEDVIADSADEAGEVIDDICMQQLHGIIEEVLSESEKTRADVIKMHFFLDMTNDEIAEKTAVPVCLVKQWLTIPALRRELKGLKADKYRSAIDQVLDLRTDFYKTGSAKNQSNPVEPLVEWREQQREKYTKRLFQDT